MMCGGNGWMWDGGYGSPGWGGWILTAIVLVVLFALLLTAIAAAVRYLSGSGNKPPTPAERTPDDVLAERYARGDIDDDEYRRRMAILRERK